MKQCSIEFVGGIINKAKECLISDSKINRLDLLEIGQPILKGEADMVNGSYYINGNKKNTPIYRRLRQIVRVMPPAWTAALMLPILRAVFGPFQAKRKMYSGLNRMALPRAEKYLSYLLKS